MSTAHNGSIAWNHPVEYDVHTTPLIAENEWLKEFSPLYRANRWRCIGLNKAPLIGYIRNEIKRSLSALNFVK